jgi:hypothetical protein
MSAFYKFKNSNKYFLNEFDKNIKKVKGLNFLGFLKLHLVTFPVSYIKYMKYTFLN